MLFIDKMILDERPRRTADGYLVAVPRIARTGIQEYLGSEVGRPDLSVVRVYRPEEEVFHKDALHSMAHRPVTIEHPPELVDSDNWKKYSRGMTGGDVARDGDFIRVPMSLMDSGAIKDVEAGKVELSMGYTADLDWTAGTTPDGEQYDAIQRKIRGNHLAIVDAARGGSQLRVIDIKTNHEGKPMTTMKRVVIDGISVETTDIAAEVYDRAIKQYDAKAKADEDRIKELEDELEELKAKRDQDKETKDAEVATLQKQLADAAMTPEKLDAAVQARARVVDAAKRVCSNVIIDGRTEADIRRQVVSAKLGDTAKDWNDEQIAASFNTLAASADPYVQVHRDSRPNQNVTAYDAYKQRLSGAYKQEA